MHYIVYYKLCHGFILICDKSNIESIVFVEKQIEKIFASSGEKEILIICQDSDFVDEEVNKYLGLIETHYHIKAKIVNINDISLTYPTIEKFLQLTYIKKNKTLKKKKATVQPTEKKTRNVRLYS